MNNTLPLTNDRIVTVPKSEREQLSEAAQNGSLELAVSFPNHTMFQQNEFAVHTRNHLSGIDKNTLDIDEDYLYAKLASSLNSLSTQARVMGKWNFSSAHAKDELIQQLKFAVRRVSEFVGPSSLVHCLHYARALERSGDIDGALDVIMRKTDELFRDGRFAEVDQFLELLDPGSYSIELLIGVLTATLIADDRLPQRLEFFQRVKRRFEAAGESVEELLFGLDKLPH